MSIMRTNELKNSQINKRHARTVEIGMATKQAVDSELPLTVSEMIKTLLEVIRVKKSYSMDEETRKQFPVIAKEIILLAEQSR